MICCIPKCGESATTSFGVYDLPYCALHYAALVAYRRKIGAPLQ